MLNPRQILHGKRIVLVKAEKSFEMAKLHIAEVQDSLPELSPWLGWATPEYKIEDSYEYLLGCNQKWEEGANFTYVITTEDIPFMGTISVFNIKEKDKCVEIGYWISTKYAGNGYMQEAVSLIEKEFFGLGLNRLVIHTDVLNIKSANVAKKCGYILDGIQRQNNWVVAEERYRDTNTFSKLKSEYVESK